MEVCSIQSQSDTFTRCTDKSSSANLSCVIDNMSSLNLKSHQNVGNGLMFNNNNDNFILTCNHVNSSNHLKYCKESILNEKIYENCDIFLTIKEIDIIILKYNARILNGISLVNYTSLFVTNINLNSGLVLKTYDSIINIDSCELKNSNIRSQLFPEIPTLCITVNDSIEMEGLSGSIVYTSDNIPVGIVVCFNNSIRKIECVYLPFLLNFIEKMISSNVSHIKGIHVNTVMCEIEYEGNDMTSNYVIEDSCNYPNGKKEFKFKKDDIIVSANNQRITDNGCINCKHILGLDMNIPMVTYLMVASTLLGRVPIVILKQTDDNDVIKREYLIDGISYSDIFTTLSFDNMRRVIWKGFIFVEMSEELIFNYEKKGYSMSKEIFKNIKSYSNGSSNIILFDINTTAVPPKYSELSFPMRGHDGNYCVLNLDKIGQKKVHNLTELYDILKLYKTSSATFTFTIKGNMNKTCKEITIENKIDSKDKEVKLVI